MISSLALVSVLLAAFWGIAALGLRITGRGAPARPLRGEHQQGIDGLRGILALSVYVHHASCFRNLYHDGYWFSRAYAFTQAGMAAVTLFFFITGFLFWTKLQRNPRPSVAQHLRSRITRLAPAYWASVVLVFLVVAVQSRGKLHESPLALLGNVGSWVAFTFPRRVDLNGIFETWHIDCGVTWTLQLEWVFYALIPFCGWFAAKLWRVGLFFGLLVGARGLVTTGLSNVERWPEIRELAVQATLYLMVVFTGGIAVAAVRPWLCRRFSTANFRSAPFSLLGLGLIVATLLLGPNRHGAPVETLWLIVPFLLIAIGNDWFGFLTSAPTLFLGKISYSIYLLHGIVLYVTCAVLNRFYPVGEISGSVYWVAIAALGGVVIALSALWHRLFEARFMSPARSEPSAPAPAMVFGAGIS